MMNIDYEINKIPDINSIAYLYDNVGWGFYTKDKDKLYSAIHNSTCVVTAWEADKLIGLTRCVGDGETIIYIQDILVLQEYQRNGIGRRMITLLLQQYPNVRQKVLLTDNTTKTVEFYKSLGFYTSETGNMIAFVKFDNPNKQYS